MLNEKSAAKLKKLLSKFSRSSRTHYRKCKGACSGKHGFFAENICADIFGATLKEMEKVGHNSPVDIPAMFNRICPGYDVSVKVTMSTQLSLNSCKTIAHHLAENSQPCLLVVLKARNVPSTPGSPPIVVYDSVSVIDMKKFLAGANLTKLRQFLELSSAKRHGVIGKRLAKSAFPETGCIRISFSSGKRVRAKVVARNFRMDKAKGLLFNVALSDKFPKFFPSRA